MRFRTDWTAKDMTQIGVFTALLIMGAWLSIPIGPVPISLHTLMFFLAMSLIKPKNVFCTTIVYLMIGLAGVPVFSGFKGGIASIISPSFGFVLSFPLISFLVGPLVYHRRKAWHKSLFLLLAEGLLYVIGLTYMTIVLFVMGQTQITVIHVLKIGLLPFLPGDLIKIVLAVWISERLQKYAYFKGGVA